MTNEELLSGFLDRSLSEDELLEFEARQAANPSYATEVREMLALEDLLSTSAPRGMAPADFLHTVENVVAAKVAAAPVSSGLFTGLSSIWTWIGGAAVTLVAVGTTLWYTSTNTASGDSQSVAEPVVAKTPTPAQVSPPAASTAEPSSDANSVSASQSSAERSAAEASRQTPTAALDRPAPVVTSQPTVASASADGTAKVDNPNEDAVTRARAELDRAVASGNNLVAARLALSLADELRSAGKTDELQSMLQRGLEYARMSRVADYEVKALGELARFESSRGYERQAATYYRQAIDIGKRAQLDVSAYESALQSLEK